MPVRDTSRLMVLRRQSGQREHRLFCDLAAYLTPGDALVLNNSRVIPARLRGAKMDTGGKFEALLLEEIGINDWWAMLRPAKRMRVGKWITFHAPDGAPVEVKAEIIAKNPEGHCRLRFVGIGNVMDKLDEIGEVPLPPYIARPANPAGLNDRERYQTVFAAFPGSVAAPTAGLHFTPGLLERIRQRGVSVCQLTLHVGPGTFAPVKTDDLASHPMHQERFELNSEAAATINATRRAGRRIFAVGTTTVRVLESIAAAQDGDLVATTGATNLFIRPPYRFQVVDGLVTNFHLPRSTLLMLVCAFGSPGQLDGRAMILQSYAEAIRLGYRFFSYGDAMLVL